MRDDSLYRLVKSTGREHSANDAATEPEAEGFNTPQNLPSDGQSLRNYTRSWTYDSIGNILSLVHQAAGGNWTRTYAYESDSNRLASTTVGAATQTYSHNAHGSLENLPHLNGMSWTPDEHLHTVARGTSKTWYSYDSTGQRVRKVTEKGGFTEERLYLGGWEIYRKRQGSTVVLEREILHILDGNRRVALIETKTIDTATTTPLPRTVTRYQLDNHLQIASLELDETASVISYEEYYPYGDTSYRSAKSGVEVSEKRYRYTGKEKDEESGLYYHGARYYAAWMGRWTAADPAGMVDGPNLYAYVRGNPILYSDPSGLLSWGQWAGIGTAIVVGTAVTVATGGLAAPVVGAAAATIIGGIVGGAVGAGVGEAVEARIDRRESHIVRSAVIGGAVGGVFAGAGVAISAGLKTATGQAATAVASRAVNAVATRAGSTSLGQAAKVGAQRVANSAAGKGAAATAKAAAKGAKKVHSAIEKPFEKAGTAISKATGIGPGSRTASALPKPLELTQEISEKLKGLATQEYEALIAGGAGKKQSAQRFDPSPSERTSYAAILSSNSMGLHPSSVVCLRV